MADTEPKWPRYLTAATSVVTVLTAAAVALLNYQISNVEGALKQEQNDREFRLKIQKMMKDSLSSADEKQQLIAIAFIKEINKPDLRCALLRVFSDLG
jgi:hypothetical protein